MEANYNLRHGFGSYPSFHESREFLSSSPSVPPEELAWVDSCLIDGLEYTDDSEIGLCVEMEAMDIAQDVGTAPSEGVEISSDHAVEPDRNIMFDRMVNLNLTPGHTLPNHMGEQQYMPTNSIAEKSLLLAGAPSRIDDIILDVQHPLFSADNMELLSGDVFQVCDCYAAEPEDDEREQFLKRLKKGILAISRYPQAYGGTRKLEEDVCFGIQRLSINRMPN